MLSDLSKSLNCSVHFIMIIMSENFALFLLDQTNNGAEILHYYVTEKYTVFPQKVHIGCGKSIN